MEYFLFTFKYYMNFFFELKLCFTIEATSGDDFIDVFMLYSQSMNNESRFAFMSYF